MKHNVFGWQFSCLLILRISIAVFPNQARSQCTSLITTFPYQESFESGAGGWTGGGVNSDWALGIPVKSTINTAGDGVNCWITGGLAGTSYNAAERSWLQSPCFDIRTLQRPEIRFLIYWETEYQYDGGNLQYSTDGGSTWRTLGGANTVACKASNWFNIGSITNLSGLANPSCGWSGTTQPSSGSCRGGNGSGGWVTARFCLQELRGQPSVIFRFTFGSGTTCNDYDGIAIDKFEMYDRPARTTGIAYTCAGPNRFQFTDQQTSCIATRDWDFGDGSTQLNGAASVIHAYTTGGLYTLTLTSQDACQGTETTTIPVRALGYAADVHPLSCIGGSDGGITLSFPAANNSITTVTWSDPSLNGNSVSGLDTGSYVFTLNAPQSCTLTDSVRVPLSPDAIVIPDLGADRSFCPVDKDSLRPSGTFSNYLWQDGSTKPFLMPASSGTYWVKVVNAAGCSGADTVTLDFNCMNRPVFPTAFTPNGDGLNETFDIFIGATTLVEWLIYDRWGSVIFSSENAAAFWTGENCPQGVYTCLVRYIDPDGLELERVGRVTLIR